MKVEYVVRKFEGRTCWAVSIVDTIEEARHLVKTEGYNRITKVVNDKFFANCKV